jgi:hypothetical protein
VWCTSPRTAPSPAIEQTADPGLILTPPSQQTDTDDGYLSASEVASLKLDADWVILSACKTAAGTAQNAEALSGLARAFIYAGARALLVSHWGWNRRPRPNSSPRPLGASGAAINSGARPQSAPRTLSSHKTFYLAFSPAKRLFHWLSLHVAHDHLRHDRLHVNLNRDLVRRWRPSN